MRIIPVLFCWLLIASSLGVVNGAVRSQISKRMATRLGILQEPAATQPVASGSGSAEAQDADSLEAKPKVVPLATNPVAPKEDGAIEPLGVDEGAEPNRLHTTGESHDGLPYPDLVIEEDKEKLARELARYLPGLIHFLETLTKKLDALYAPNRAKLMRADDPSMNSALENGCIALANGAFPPQLCNSLISLTKTDEYKGKDILDAGTIRAVAEKLEQAQMSLQAQGRAVTQEDKDKETSSDSADTLTEKGFHGIEGFIENLVTTLKDKFGEEYENLMVDRNGDTQRTILAECSETAGTFQIPPNSCPFIVDAMTEDKFNGMNPLDPAHQQRLITRITILYLNAKINAAAPLAEEKEKEELQGVQDFLKQVYDAMVKEHGEEFSSILTAQQHQIIVAKFNAECDKIAAQASPGIVTPQLCPKFTQAYKSLFHGVQAWNGPVPIDRLVSILQSVMLFDMKPVPGQKPLAFTTPEGSSPAAGGATDAADTPKAGADAVPEKPKKQKGEKEEKEEEAVSPMIKVYSGPIEATFPEFTDNGMYMVELKMQTFYDLLAEDRKMLQMFETEFRRDVALAAQCHEEECPKRICLFSIAREDYGQQMLVRFRIAELSSTKPHRSSEVMFETLMEAVATEGSVVSTLPTLKDVRSIEMIFPVPKVKLPPMTPGMDKTAIAKQLAESQGKPLAEVTSTETLADGSIITKQTVKQDGKQVTITTTTPSAKASTTKEEAPLEEKAEEETREAEGGSKEKAPEAQETEPVKAPQKKGSATEEAAKKEATAGSDKPRNVLKSTTTVQEEAPDGTATTITVEGENAAAPKPVSEAEKKEQEKLLNPTSVMASAAESEAAAVVGDAGTAEGAVKTAEEQAKEIAAQEEKKKAVEQEEKEASLKAEKETQVAVQKAAEEEKAILEKAEELKKAQEAKAEETKKAVEEKAAEEVKKAEEAKKAVTEEKHWYDSLNIFG